MKIAKRVCFWMLFGLIILVGFDAHAEVVSYTLDNVILEEGTQMTGTFTWTYDVGNFENGVGEFTSLVIPYTSHNHLDLEAIIDVTQSIEITLPGSTHDDGVDITLVLLTPLTPTTGSLINLVLSKYEIGGNGFHDGVFVSGSISPTLSTEIFADGFESGNTSAWSHTVP
jgi:hypothetical protein